MYYPQIDFIKALAIISVIFLHTFGYGAVPEIAILTIFQAVPIFFILMGITTVISFEGQTFPKISDFYTRDYFMKKIYRIIAPFFIIYCIDIAYVAYSRNFSPEWLHYPWLTLIGVLPSGGLGNYFVSILIQFILIAPLMYYLYKKNPSITLTGFFCIGLLFEVLAPLLPIYSLYGNCILRYIFAIGLGFFIADEFINNQYISIRKGNNRYLLLFVPLSIVYLQFFGGIQFPLFRPEWASQNVLSFFYSLVLVIVLIDLLFYLKPSGNVYDSFNTIGKASYHIFLVQMLYFVTGFPLHVDFTVIAPILSPILLILFNLAITISLGLFFYYTDIRFISPYLKKKNPWRSN